MPPAFWKHGVLTTRTAWKVPDHSFPTIGWAPGGTEKPELPLKTVVILPLLVKTRCVGF